MTQPTIVMVKPRAKAQEPVVPKAPVAEQPPNYRPYRKDDKLEAAKQNLAAKNQKQSAFGSSATRSPATVQKNAVPKPVRRK